MMLIMAGIKMELFITSNTKPYLSHLRSDKTKYKEDELKRVEIIEKN